MKTFSGICSMEYMKHNLFSETEVNSAFKNLLIFIGKKTIDEMTRRHDEMTRRLNEIT